MSKNRKNFIVGIVGSIIVFVMGVLYMVIPNYYGVDNLGVVDTNNLFLSMAIVYSVINFGFYYIMGENPNKETLWLCIVSALCGLLNSYLSTFLSSSLTLSLSILALTLAITSIRLFTVDYYHDRKDAYYFIEGLLLICFFVCGFTLSFCMFDDTIIQTIELGFFQMMIGLIEGIKITTKCLLKAPRFLGKIKF